MEVFSYKACKALSLALVVKTQRTLSPCVWVHKFKCPQFVHLLESIMATFDVHKYILLL